MFEHVLRFAPRRLPLAMAVAQARLLLLSKRGDRPLSTGAFGEGIQRKLFRQDTSAQPFVASGNVFPVCLRSSYITFSDISKASPKLEKHVTDQGG